MRETPSTRLPALRQLLHARFPTTTHGRSPPLPTGLPALDEATGGLPRPALTELVAARPS
jgi:replicative DNA helicase